MASITLKSFGRVIPAIVACAAFIHCVDDAAPVMDSTDGGVDGGTTSDAAPLTDAAGTDSGTASDTGTDAGLPNPCPASTGCPNKVNPSHLQLWLRGDVGVGCASGAVTKWRDLSGHGRDALPPVLPDGGPSSAPGCGVGSLNSRPIVSFTRPDAGGGPFIAGTMQVDLSFLAGVSHTIFVIHRPALASGIRGLLAADNTHIGVASCVGSKTNDGRLDFIFDTLADGGSAVFSYDNATSCPFYSTSYYPLKPAMIDVFSFDVATGHKITAEGLTVFTGDGGGEDLHAVADVGLRPASIGRESNADYDGRYEGDVAEILVYDATLTTELGALQGYFFQTWGLD